LFAVACLKNPNCTGSGEEEEEEEGESSSSKVSNLVVVSPIRRGHGSAQRKELEIGNGGGGTKETFFMPLRMWTALASTATSIIE
jgi:hypothetical protein